MQFFNEREEKRVWIFFSSFSFGCVFAVLPRHRFPFSFFSSPVAVFPTNPFYVVSKSSCLAQRTAEKETRIRDFKCFKNACLSVCLRPKLSDIFFFIYYAHSRFGTDFLLSSKVHSRVFFVCNQGECRGERTINLFYDSWWETLNVIKLHWGNWKCSDFPFVYSHISRFSSCPWFLWR